MTELPSPYTLPRLMNKWLQQMEGMVPSITPILLASFVFLSSTQGISACVHTPNERLQNYCAVRNSSNTTVPLRQAQAIDARLKREGYARGLGLPGKVEQFTFQPYITPIIDYSTDINGGNPDRPLVLGSLDFTGDPTLVRKEGVIAGLSAGANGRIIYGEGRHLDYGLGASYAHSTLHDIGILRSFAGACSKNRIVGWWYLDVCANANHTEKELIEETSRSQSVTAARVFSTGPLTHHQASIGLRRLDDEDYDQRQFTLGLETAHRNGIYTSFNMAFGEPVGGSLVTKQSISGTLGITLAGRPLRASVGYSSAEGGRILGFERNDDSRFVNVKYAIHPQVSLSVGYRQTDSTINYFDESEPVFGIQFTPLRF